MCMKYDKEVSVIGYSTLTGISQSIIYEWANGESRKLSSKGMDIYKKLNEFREESLSNKLVTGNKNPVGAISVSNYVYLNPISTVVCSALVLHEPTTWIAILGSALILSGVFVANKRGV